MNKYVIYNVSKGQFLSGCDENFFDDFYTNDFNDSVLFDSQSEAEYYAFLIDEEVIILKFCSKI